MRKSAVPDFAWVLIASTAICSGPLQGQEGSRSAKLGNSEILPPIERPCDTDSEAPTDAVDTVPSIIAALLTPSATRHCYITTSAGERSQLYVIQKGTLRKVAFSIWETDSGGGSIQGEIGVDPDDPVAEAIWSLTCRMDKIDDSRSCHLRRGDLFVFRTETGHLVDVGSDNYPGSSISIRVDDHPPLTAPAKTAFQEAQAKRVLGQLRSGRNVVTRYQKWPYESYIDTEISLYGAAEALDLLDKAFLSLRKPARRDVSRTLRVPRNEKLLDNETASHGGVTTLQGANNQTYFEFQVDKPAEMLPQDSIRPKYPSVLESSGIPGEVQVQFVVTSGGIADMDSFKVLKSTNELFTQAVKTVLPKMRFNPATIKGRAVNQLVQQSFEFSVPRR